MSRPPAFSVVAIIAAYNEADVLPTVVQHLVANGVSVYLIDDGSTDGTPEAVRRWLGRGLIGIEGSPSATASGDSAGRFRWEAILRRKEELALEIEADWIIHHDADEFRESPWPHLDLRAAIELVDRLGYNTIDFHLMNFRPTDDRFRSGDDVREKITRYEPAEPWNSLQIKAWKRIAGVRVDLAQVGGHDVRFQNRRVFPIRFPLRHYPIRSAAHGERKVKRERLPRFDPDERAKGWHVQYDETRHFLRRPEELVVYDAERVRIEIAIENRRVEELVRAVDAAESRVTSAERETSERLAEAEATRRDLAALRVRLDGTRAQLEASRSEASSALRELAEARAAHTAATAELSRERRSRAEVETNLAEARGGLARAQALVAEATAERDAARAELEHTAVDRDRLAAERDVAQTALDAATVDRDRVAAELAAERFAHAEARHHRDELLASRSWRWTAPLRRVFRGLRRSRIEQ